MTSRAASKTDPSKFQITILAPFPKIGYFAEQTSVMQHANNFFGA